MPWKFNPFTGSLDQTGSGGGGASYIDGEVATYNDLPLDGTAAADSAWLVREASGTWLIGRKPAGIYVRTATAGVSRDADYTYAGIFPDVFSDANFTLYDDGDSTKTAKFQLSAIATGTTRTISVPNKSITLDDAADARDPKSHVHAASDVTSGTFDNARINFAAPSSIGSTTPSTGAFTTLNANNGTLTASAPVLLVQQTWNDSAANFVGASVEITNNNNANNSSSLFRVRLGTTDALRIDRFRDVHLGASLQMGAAATANVGSLRLAGFVSLVAPSTGIVDQREGSNPCAFRLYNTYTDASNYERAKIAWSSNVLQIGTEKAGTGSARALEFQTDGTTRVTIGTGGAATFTNTVTANGTSNGFETSSAPNGASPVRFSADAGNVVIQTALNPGITEIRGITATNPQTFRILNTRSSSTNFERFNIRWASNECIIETEAGSGGGTLRGIKLGSATTQPIGFWNATPAAQPAAVADATDAASTQARLNDLLARLRTIGIIAT